MNILQDRGKAFYISVITVSILAIIGFGKASATPESRAAMLFLFISPSTRVNGMGQAGVALADEPGGYYNPATPALMAEHHFFGTVNYLGKLEWLPVFPGDMRYSYNAVQLGLNSKRIAPLLSGKDGLDLPFSVSGALSYYRTKMDLGERVRTDEFGRELGTVRSFDKADCFVLSAGLHSVLDIGIGMSVKRLASTMGYYEQCLVKISGTAYDMGVQLRLPVVEAVQYLSKRKLTAPPLQPRLNLTGGVSWNNRGGDITYPCDIHDDPLPANRKIGWAVEWGLSWRGALDLFNSTVTLEKYTPQIKGVKIEKEASDDKAGYEFSFLETVEIRHGRYNDDDGEIHLYTEGFTLKSDGIFKLAALLISHGCSTRMNPKRIH